MIFLLTSGIERFGLLFLKESEILDRQPGQDKYKNSLKWQFNLHLSQYLHFSFLLLQQIT